MKTMPNVQVNMWSGVSPDAAKKIINGILETTMFVMQSNMHMLKILIVKLNVLTDILFG